MSRSRRRAPTRGTTSQPRNSAQAMANCATVTPFACEIPRSASTSARLRCRLYPVKRGRPARKSAACERSADQ